MAYRRKTRDVYKIMTNYGYGWECECEEYDLSEAKRRKKEYLENTKAAVYIRKTCELIQQGGKETT